MLYRVAGDPKIGYDLGVGTGTYGGYVRWVRTLVRVRYGGTVRGYGMRVRYGGTVRGYGTGGTVRGYGTVGTVRGYGTGVRRTGTVYPPYLFSGNVVLFPKCGALYRYGVPPYRTPVPYPPYRTPVPYSRTVPPYRTPVPYPYLKHVPTQRTRTQKHVPASRTVPKPPRYVHRTPPWCSDREPWFHNSSKLIIYVHAYCKIINHTCCLILLGFLGMNHDIFEASRPLHTWAVFKIPLSFHEILVGLVRDSPFLDDYQPQYRGFHSHGGTKNGRFISWKVHQQKNGWWTGYPYFRKPPYVKGN